MGAWSNYRDSRNPRDKVIKIRLSAEELEQLDQAVAGYHRKGVMRGFGFHDASRSEVLRSLLGKFVKGEVSL